MKHALRLVTICSALGLCLLLHAAEDPNWLTNIGFEDGTDGRPAGWDLGMEGRGEGEAVWQQGGAHSGERCVRVALTTAGDYYMARQRLTQSVTPGNVYQINGWYRSDSESVAHPCVYFVAADGRVISAWESALPLSRDWRRFLFSFTAPADTARLEVQLRAQTTPGAAWFDDVFVGPAAALQAEQEARTTAFRQALVSGPLQLRALRPSERPQLLELAGRERWSELQQAKQVDIFAARQERESFGALVLGLGSGKATVRLSALTLKGGRGAAIPAAAATVRWAEWVQTNNLWVPDPLLEKQPFSAPEHGAPLIWVTVHVPERAPAGTYEGALAVEAAGRSASLPVRLQVHDFTLPRTSALPSSFWVFRHALRNAYGLKEVPFDFYRKTLDLCLQSRLAPIDAAEWHDQPLVQMVRDERGELQVDWAPWDQYLQYCFDRGMSACNVADDHWFNTYFSSFTVKDLKTGKSETVTLDRNSREWEETVVRFFRLAYEHFTQHGWADKAYLQGYDEPGNDPELLAQIKHYYALARTGWPGLPTLITTPIGFGGLDDSIGIWCPLTPSYDDAKAAAARARGQRVWWYVCCGPTAPWANFFLNQPGAAHRVLFWQTYGRKADGLLYWGVNHWPDYCGRSMDPVPPEKRWPAAPWNDGGRNGDGYFLYPGPDGPLTSMRFEIMRDGVEDYDALKMLEQLARAKQQRLSQPLRERVEAALTPVPRVYLNMTNYPADAGAMVSRRREVNGLIVRLQRL